MLQLTLLQSMATTAEHMQLAAALAAHYHRKGPTQSAELADVVPAAL